LILQYGADTSIISLLLAICAAFGIVFSPLIGKLIDRVGY
jgi:MFS family permease